MEGKRGRGKGKMGVGKMGVGKMEGKREKGQEGREKGMGKKTQIKQYQNGLKNLRGL